MQHHDPYPSLPTTTSTWSLERAPSKSLPTRSQRLQTWKEVPSRSAQHHEQRCHNVCSMRTLLRGIGSIRGPRTIMERYGRCPPDHSGQTAHAARAALATQGGDHRTAGEQAVVCQDGGDGIEGAGGGAEGRYSYLTPEV